MKKIHARRHEVGFTLIEVLIVIAMIAVLSLAGYSAGKRMMAGAKSARCLGNLRQIGAGVISYTTEHNGMFPEDWLGPEHPDYDGVHTWVMRTVPYLGDRARSAKTLWVCPDAKLPVTDNYDDMGNVNNDWVTTYSIHGRLAGPRNPSYPDIPRMRLSMVNRPNDVIMVADGVQNPDNHNLVDVSLWNPNNVIYQDYENKNFNKILSNRSANTMGNFSYHHPGDHMNAVMVDGSARSFKTGEVLYRNVQAKDAN